MAEGVLDQVQKGVDITGGAVDILLRTEAGQALDEKLADKINPMSGYEILREQMPKTADAFDENGAKVVNEAGDIAVEWMEIANEVLKEEIKKDHGSKVKVGAFKGCSVVYAGSKSCIVVDKETNKILYLTPEHVTSCRYVKSKFRLRRGKKYYYYELVFKNGLESYVRVSSEHRENLERCGLQNIETSIFKELSPGEEYEDDVD